MKLRTLPAILLLLWCTTAVAQRKIDRSQFAEVDKYVADLGPMEGHLLKHIVDTLTHHQTGPKINQVRALYMWEVKNIDYDTKARRHPKQANPSASAALNDRAAAHDGYANLFKAMCDLARIPCAVVPGLAKFDERNIGKLTPKWNKHTWNAVQIDGTWYLLDIPWSAGTTDRKFRFYKRNFSDAWFLTDRELFALSHYPNDKKWQLLDTPYNKSNFTQAPIIGRSAITNEVYTDAIRGKVKSKADTFKSMEFDLGNPELIRSVSITRRTNSQRIPVIYTIEGDKLYVNVPFASMGDYPFNLYVNDELAYTYQADIGKAKKKPQPKPQPKTKKKTSEKKSDGTKKKIKIKNKASKERKAKIKEKPASESSN